MNTNNTNTNTNKLETLEISPKEFYSKVCTRLLLNFDSALDININKESYINDKQRTCLLSYSYDATNKTSAKNFSLKMECFVEIKIKRNNIATLYEKDVIDGNVFVKKHKTTFDNEHEYSSILLDKIELILMKNDKSGFLAINELECNTFYATSNSENYAFYKSRLICDFSQFISGKSLFDINENNRYNIQKISEKVFHDDVYKLNNFECIKKLLKFKIGSYRYYSPVSRTKTSNNKYIIEKYIILSGNDSIFYIFYSEEEIIIFKADDCNAYIFTILSGFVDYKDKINTDEFLLPQIVDHTYCTEAVCENKELQFNEYFNKCINRCKEYMKKYNESDFWKSMVLKQFMDKITSEKHIINNPNSNVYEIISHKHLVRVNNLKDVCKNYKECIGSENMFLNSLLHAYKYKVSFVDDQYYKHYITLKIETTMYKINSENKLSEETETTNLTVHVSDIERIKRLFYEHTLAPEEFALNI